MFDLTDVSYGEMMAVIFIVFVILILLYVSTFKQSMVYGGDDDDTPNQNIADDDDDEMKLGGAKSLNNDKKFIKKAIQFRMEDELVELLTKGKKKYDIRSASPLFTDTASGDVLIYYSDSKVVPVKIKSMTKFKSFNEALEDTPAKDVFGKDMKGDSYAEAFKFVSDEKKKSNSEWLRFEIEPLCPCGK